MGHYTMLSEYGNCTHLLKFKKQAENRLFVQTKSGRILDVLWVFLIKQHYQIHLRLLDEKIIKNLVQRTSLAIYHLISNEHLGNNIIVN